MDGRRFCCNYARILKISRGASRRFYPQRADDHSLIVATVCMFCLSDASLKAQCANGYFISLP